VFKSKEHEIVLREVQNLVGINHPGLVNLISYGFDENLKN